MTGTVARFGFLLLVVVGICLVLAALQGLGEIVGPLERAVH